MLIPLAATANRRPAQCRAGMTEQLRVHLQPQIARSEKVALLLLKEPPAMPSCRMAAVCDCASIIKLTSSCDVVQPGLQERPGCPYEGVCAACNGAISLSALTDGRLLWSSARVHGQVPECIQPVTAEPSSYSCLASSKRFCCTSSLPRLTYGRPSAASMARHRRRSCSALRSASAR